MKLSNIAMNVGGRKVDTDLNKECNKSDDETLSSEKAEDRIDKNQEFEVPISDTITETSANLRNINIIREELCKLSLNPCEREYFNNCILPLLTTLTGITSASSNLASSASDLSNSNILFRKKSNIKDTLDLVYDINKKSEDVYKALVKRIDKMLDCIE